MDLIDRYVHRVRFFLPRRQQDDIIRELAADLRSEVQDTASRLGRPLDDAGVGAILKRWGHPILVAGRYLPEQYLIGPALFPVYWFVLKIATAFYLVPWLVVWLGLVILSPTYRAAHDGLALLGPLSTWWQLALGTLGMVTLVFAILERAQVRAGFFGRWDPAGLPVARDHHAIPRFGSITEVVGAMVFLLWWTGNLHFPSVEWSAAVWLTPSAAFSAFYWPILLQATFGLAVSGVNLFRPWWTLGRALARLATNLAVVVIAALLLQAGPWLVVDAPAMEASARDALVRGANLGVYWLLLGIGLVALLVACFEDGRRIFRLLSERTSARA